jgi:hypothetical protein
LINKIDKKRLPQDLDGSMTLILLTKQKEFGEQTKKYDKGCPTKVDSHSIDKLKKKKNWM